MRRKDGTNTMIAAAIDGMTMLIAGVAFLVFGLVFIAHLAPIVGGFLYFLFDIIRYGIQGRNGR